jgi:hypothetical protein
MRCLINKIKNWFSSKKECCNKYNDCLLKQASLTKEEVDSVIIDSFEKVKKTKKPKAKSKPKPKVKTKTKKPKR